MDEMTRVRTLLAAAATMAAAIGRSAPIRLYFREGELTVDGRTIDPQSVNFDRVPPLPIQIQRTEPETGGHSGAELCGVIDAVMRDGDVLVAEGRIDLGSEAGSEAWRLGGGLGDAPILQTWSPDLANVIADLEEADDGMLIERVVQATLIGATLLPMPALDAAVFELLGEDGEPIVPAPDRNGPPPPETHPLEPDEDMLIMVGGVRDPAETAGAVATRLLACADPASRPPTSWFEDPQLPELERFLTIEEPDEHGNRRVYGHLFGWGECHVGYPHTCMELTPDSEDDYPYFTVGTVLTREGTLVPTGALTLRGGHDMDLSHGYQDAQRYYDDTRSAFADVAIGKDRFGAWIAGAIRPGTSEDDVRAARASGVSGDWREIAARLRLIAGCSVNQPGFPKVRARLASGRVVAMVAAGGHPQPAPGSCGCRIDQGNAMTAARLRRLEAIVAAAGLKNTALDALAARL